MRNVWLAVLLIIGLIGIGFYQSENLPKSSLAGATTLVKTQDEINKCMNHCMRQCSNGIGEDYTCQPLCEEQCNV